VYVNTLLRVEGNVVMVRAARQLQGGETRMIMRGWGAPFEAQGKASLRPYNAASRGGKTNADESQLSFCGGWCCI
jgi:hypothetical protein